MKGNTAKLVRFVTSIEQMEELIQYAKVLSYTKESEVALLGLHNGRRAIVIGGPFGIDLHVVEAESLLGGSARSLWIDTEYGKEQVLRLIFHTHPIPTGPSDGDCMILEMLSQEKSMLYELFGPREGTEFRRKKR